ncbi:phosphoglucosamine mutase [Clostridium cylindrosporum]|uniref:Phosphoglucosamine mutase n=1 Tax=Clostridium cylindrosporum DSM 605 TaxID=1121307 RepID=A0A0J8D5P6_CLOCY|nr:phosphoglucosamine mutase [Clostridium cylindrosporum]KMT21172.1 phosphoglucosamine mutase GlmM [Clostridium cylindrosporum DSM 605]
MGRMFGTDGVRGIANTELTANLAYNLGRAGAFVLSDAKEKPTILVGKDTRISGDMLESALVAGICSVGARAICVGVVPTPAIAYLTRYYNADAGVVISASHNPVEYNGIKFFNKDGYKLHDSVEDKIENFLENNLEGIPYPSGTEIGIREQKIEAIEDYINYLKESINGDFSGLKIAIDCAEGASFYSAPKIFKDLGAEVYVIHNNPDGTNINKNCGSTHMGELRSFVQSMGCDIGFALDGDADRCLAVDENGEDIDGDHIIAILSKALKEEGKLKEDTAVVTVMSNMGLDIASEKEGIKLVKTKVGDRYVLEEMLKGGYKIGGEQSGHVILLDYNTTGDGLMTALSLSKVLKSSGQKSSELRKTMTVLPQVLINAKVTNDKKNLHEVDEEVKALIVSAEEELNGRGRVLIRASGTEPLIRVMLEGEDFEKIEVIAKNIASLIENKAK